MTTADRVHAAAAKIRKTVEVVQALTPQDRTRVDAFPSVVALRALGFDREDVALAVADWLDETAADKTAGRGTIHPRAIDLTNLILGDTA